MADTIERMSSARNRDSFTPPIVRFLFIVLLLIVFVGICVWILARQPFENGRFTIMAISDPVEIVSYDQNRNFWTIIQMTKDAHISGVFGLGEYRLDALWQLGKSESSPSAILRESLAEELGVHIPYYIVPSTSDFTQWSGPISILQETITLTNLLPFLKHRFDTNMSFPDYLRFWWRIRNMEPQRVERYIIKEGSGLVRQTEPDGAWFLRFDRQAFDIRTQDAFEELQVRKEALRVAVYNTTNTPGVGARVGRMIGKLGANVVAVGNDTESQVQGCEMTGNQESLERITTKRIISLFECEYETIQEEQQADLTIRVGKTFADRFINN